MLMENANPTARHFSSVLLHLRFAYFLFITYGPSKILPDPLDEALDRPNGEDMISLLF